MVARVQFPAAGPRDWPSASSRSWRRRSGRWQTGTR